MGPEVGKLQEIQQRLHPKVVIRGIVQKEKEQNFESKEPHFRKFPCWW